jgi:sigma-B regulation protein RsbU (phosphoserine phosphatase)
MLNKSTHTSLIIIIAAAVLLQTISAVQYYYTQNLLADELEKRAESEMTTKAVIVKNALNLAENSLNGHIWDMKLNIAYPDSMYNVEEWVLRSHPNLLGCGIAFVPDFYPEKGRLYEPYVYRQHGGQGQEVFVKKQVGGPDHDYTLSGFYKVTMKRNTTFWSYPYYDNITNSQIVTFCRPIHNEKKDIVAVFGLDIDVKWLGDTLNYRHIYPSSYNFLLTETGQLIAGPQHESDQKREEMEHIIRLINDSTVQKSLSNSGRSTVLPIEDSDGDKGLVFYANFKGNPKWQIALVCYDKEVYAKLNTMRWTTGILMIVGLLVLGLMISRFAKNDRKLHQANLEKERIGGELRVASQIQQSMLPHSHILHDDVSIFGSLVPAREVGGDLYDYFIRDEKLFFCIGDVSGKGAPSAMVMGVIHSLFRAFSAHENNPAHIMQAINEVSCQGNDSNIFVTLFLGVLDLPTGLLRYCDAGHDAPMMLADGQCSMIDVNPHLPVGVFDDVKYGIQETKLEPNITLFLYTDGLTEAKNIERKQFGIKRVEEVLAANSGLHPEQLLESVRMSVHEFVGDAEQSDDLTMLAIRYTPKRFETKLMETLVIKNDVHEVSKFSEFMKKVMERLNVEKSLSRQLRLAVEEAVVNVIDYAYPIGQEGEIEVRMMSDGKTLKTIITDSGVAFDPTAKEKADTTLSAEDRQVGGLGILLVRGIMDSVNYERINKQNILTLTKKYN